MLHKDLRDSLKKKKDFLFLFYFLQNIYLYILI